MLSLGVHKFYCTFESFTVLDLNRVIVPITAFLVKINSPSGTHQKSRVNKVLTQVLNYSVCKFIFLSEVTAITETTAGPGQGEHRCHRLQEAQPQGRQGPGQL